MISQLRSDTLDIIFAMISLESRAMRRKIRLKRRGGYAVDDEPRYRVQLFGPRGSYPKGTFCNAAALFHADEDMVFAITYGCGWKNLDHLPYSEVDWLKPEVVRLLGSMLLAEDTEESLRCGFYPLVHGRFEIDEPTLDLTNSQTAELVKDALVDTIDNADWPKYIQEIWASCLGRSFDLIPPTEETRQLRQRYYDAFDPDNHVLMRGVQALIKSDMLGHYQEFQEESTIATFIALDASFELVMRHLAEAGVKNPGSKEAGDWLYRTFDEPLGFDGGEGMKYFEEFYDQRIQTIHPGNRFGDAPYAPVMIDDRIHLRIALPQVFGYLLVGEHAPHFLRRVEGAARAKGPKGGTVRQD
jgi:hypothetical protein